MERFPLRARRLIQHYARPWLVEWAFPGGVKAAVDREDSYHYVTAVSQGAFESDSNPRADGSSWAMVGTHTSDWCATILKPGAILGLTNRPTPWLGLPEGSTGSIELRVKFVSDVYHYELEWLRLDCSERRTLALLRVPRQPSFPGPDSSVYDLVYCAGARLRFSVDLASSTLTVCFHGLTLQAVVPDLASYRPFCFFERSKSAKVQFEAI